MTRGGQQCGRAGDPTPHRDGRGQPPDPGPCRAGEPGLFRGRTGWSRSRLPASMWTVVSNMDICAPGPDVCQPVARLRRIGTRARAVHSESAQWPTQNPYLARRPSVRSMRRRRLMLANPVVAQIANVAGALKARLRPRERPPDQCRQPVYAPHGSMIVFHRRYFVEGGSLAHPVFLFNEEINVAEQCRRLRLPVLFEPVPARGPRDPSVARATAEPGEPPRHAGRRRLRLPTDPGRHRPRVSLTGLVHPPDGQRRAAGAVAAVQRSPLSGL